jgi:NAD(P)H dehydrogenase (quinone)
MKVLIVFAHHEPRSFNGALKDVAVATLGACGHEVIVSDLYSADFQAAGTRADFVRPTDPNYFKYQEEQRAAWASGSGDGFAADIREEQRRLAWCDLVIFQFPLWWFSVPAILKGWIDRVLAVGFAYGGGHWFETAPLAGRKALLSMTMGAMADRWGAEGLFGELEWVLHPLRVGTLNFCGFEVLRHHIVHAPAAMTEDQRMAVLRAWEKRLTDVFDETPLPFRRVSDFADPRHRDV